MSAVEDAVRDTIVAERTGVLALAKVFGGQVDALVESGRVPAAEATLLKDRIRAFADSIATGLHRDGADPIGVRELMRHVMRDNQAR